MASNPRRILVVDDEHKIVDVVGSYLAKSGYAVSSAATGLEALEAFDRDKHCLVILDLMLPDLSGEEVCRRIRARSRVPIIMLTAKVEDADAVRGLGLGADDYVAKPFSPRQLMARVEAVLRRAAGAASPLAAELSFAEGALLIEGETGRVVVKGKAVDLTPREHRLLRVMAANPGRVFSREELISLALGSDFDGFDRTVDAHVKNLRRKIGDGQRSPKFILTVHGIGYKFSAETAAPRRR
jgi:DNA-binding response OmpR family regulator